MTAGIDASAFTLAFVTQRYIDKVAGKNQEDNCKKEFLYAAKRNGADKMIAVVLEKKCRNQSDWAGGVGMTLGNHMYIDMCVTDNELEPHVKKLGAELDARLQKFYPNEWQPQAHHLHRLSSRKLSLILNKFHLESDSGMTYLSRQPVADAFRKINELEHELADSKNFFHSLNFLRTLGSQLFPPYYLYHCWGGWIHSINRETPSVANLVSFRAMRRYMDFILISLSIHAALAWPEYLFEGKHCRTEWLFVSFNSEASCEDTDCVELRLEACLPLILYMVMTTVKAFAVASKRIQRKFDSEHSRMQEDKKDSFEGLMEKIVFFHFLHSDEGMKKMDTTNVVLALGFTSIHLITFFERLHNKVPTSIHFSFLCTIVSTFVFVLRIFREIHKAATNYHCRYQVQSFVQTLLDPERLRRRLENKIDYYVKHIHSYYAFYIKSAFSNGGTRMGRADTVGKVALPRGSTPEMFGTPSKTRSRKSLTALARIESGKAVKGEFTSNPMVSQMQGPVTPQTIVLHQRQHLSTTEAAAPGVAQAPNGESDGDAHPISVLKAIVDRLVENWQLAVTVAEPESSCNNLRRWFAVKSYTSIYVKLRYEHHDVMVAGVLIWTNFMSLAAFCFLNSISMLSFVLYGLVVNTLFALRAVKFAMYVNQFSNQRQFAKLLLQPASTKEVSEAKALRTLAFHAYHCVPALVEPVSVFGMPVVDSDHMRFLAIHVAITFALLFKLTQALRCFWELGAG
jgi:hypothetical protein